MGEWSFTAHAVDSNGKCQYSCYHAFLWLMWLGINILPVARILLVALKTFQFSCQSWVLWSTQPNIPDIWISWKLKDTNIWIFSVLVRCWLTFVRYQDPQLIQDWSPTAPLTSFRPSSGPPTLHYHHLRPLTIYHCSLRPPTAFQFLSL